jgi:hypothetical protein
LTEGLVRWLFGGALSYPSGAVAAWRDPGTGMLGYPYPEITGYFLTLAASLGHTGTQVVRRAAAWLIDRHRRGERESRPPEPGVVYTFDTLIQATGLLNYGRAEGCDAALTLATRIVLDEARRVLDEGDISPLARSSRPPVRPPTWSTVGRLHLLKSVQGFCLAHEVSGSACARDAAALIVARRAGGIQVRSPHLAGPAGRHHLHPFCYALEGLWVWSRATGDGSAAAQAKARLGELAEHRLPDGGLPGTAGAVLAQLDVTAQAVRLGVLLAGGPFRPGLTRQFLRAHVRPAPDGGRYVPYRAEGRHHQSSWASMFTVQALRAERDGLNWRHLV